VTTAVDTNILLDVLIPEAPHNLESRLALAATNREGALIVSEPVIAELAGYFADQVLLQRFLNETRLRLEPSTTEALLRAGIGWRDYSRRRGTGVSCPACGTAHDLSCTNCGRGLSPRQHVLADFLIGAHALVHADQLLTRDRSIYRTYFPELRLA
jgi:hypothetical protein